MGGPNASLSPRTKNAINLCKNVQRLDRHQIHRDAVALIGIEVVR